MSVDRVTELDDSLFAGKIIYRWSTMSSDSRSTTTIFTMAHWPTKIGRLFLDATRNTKLGKNSLIIGTELFNNSLYNSRYWLSTREGRFFSFQKYDV